MLTLLERKERLETSQKSELEKIRSVRKAFAPGEIGRPGEEVSRRQRYPPAARFRLHRAPTTSHKIYFICYVFCERLFYIIYYLSDHKQRDNRYCLLPSLKQNKQQQQ